MACAQVTEEFGKRLDALDMLVAEAKKAVLFSVELRLSKIEFVYTTKSIGVCPKSTLFVRLYPLKNHPFYLHLYEVMRADDFRCTYFPMIEGAERMRACFDVLAGMVEEYLPTIEALALDERAYEAALSEKRQAVLRCAGIKEEKVPDDPELATDFWETWNSFYEQFVSLASFTNNTCYIAFLKGDLGKAKKLYKKRLAKGNLLPYEERLLSFLETPAAADYQPISAECAGVLQTMSYSNGKEEGKLLLVTALFCYLAVLAVEWLIAGITCLVLGQGAYFPFDWAFLFILPFGSAVFGSVALRRLFMPLVFRADAEKMAQVDRVVNSKKGDGVAIVLTVLITVAMLFFGFVSTASTTRFYTERMVYDDGTKFPLFHFVTYTYEEIEQVYYIKGRINAYDELVERGSYVLVFKDGMAIDLDASVTVEQTETHVLPLLEPYIDEVITCSTDQALAQRYEKDVDTFFNYSQVW